MTLSQTVIYTPLRAFYIYLQMVYIRNCVAINLWGKTFHVMLYFSMKKVTVSFFPLLLLLHVSRYFLLQENAINIAAKYYEIDSKQFIDNRMNSTYK